tara:strand:- start:279 stop:1667 length:1389 start_codon:yes stop_codon:yes gene_type:complete
MKSYYQKFPYKVQPWQHQLDALQASDSRESFAYFMEQGTGKTKTIIDEAQILNATGKINNVIIVCPKSLMMTWKHEIECHARDYKIIIWKDKNMYLSEMISITYYIINIDAINTGKGYEWAFARTNKESLMVIDESTVIKNHKAKRTVNAWRIGKQAGYRRILTGTPITKNPLDLYSQMVFLDPYFWSGSFYSFRNKFAIMGGYNNKEVVGFKNQEMLTDMVDIHSFRVTKDECMTLPPKVYSKRYIEMTKEQKETYKQVSSELGSFTYSEKTGNVYNKTMTVLGKLHQIVGGNLKETGEEFDCNKINEALNILNEGAGKTLIWCRYIKEIQRLEDVLICNGYEVGTFYGEIKPKQKEKNIEAFKYGDMDVLILQYQSGGVGLNLQEAKTCIFYSNDYSYGNRIQAEDRCHRGGSKHSVNYIDLITPKSIDIKILKTLENKKSLSDEVMNGLTKEDLDEILW